MIESLSLFLLRAFAVLGSTLALRGLLRGRLAAAARFRLLLASALLLPLLALLPSGRDIDEAGIGRFDRTGVVLADQAGPGNSRSGGLEGARTRGLEVSAGIALVLVGAWALGAAHALARMALAAASTARTLRSLRPPRDGAWALSLAEARNRLGMRKRPFLLEGRFASPFVAFRAGAAFVVPEDPESWSEERRLAAMLHELGHVKRHDLAFMAIVGSLLASAWCLPFAARFIKALSEDAEEACDAIVVQGGTRPSLYATLILELSSPGAAGFPPLASGIGGATGAARRIRRILEGEPAGPGAAVLSSLAALLLAAAVAVSSTFTPLFAAARTGPKVELPAIERGGEKATRAYPIGSLPQAKPLEGRWRVTRGFGDSFEPVADSARLHTGVDYSNGRSGDAVMATMESTVIEAGRDASLGSFVVLGRGETTALFAHLSRVDVKGGDRVREGQAIGAVGNSGRSTGPHLHYEVRVGGAAIDAEAISAAFAGEVAP